MSRLNRAMTYLRTLSRRTAAWYLAGGVVVLIGGYYLLFSSAHSLGATITIAPGDYPQQVAVSGTVVAARAVDLGFSQSGRVASVQAVVGQHVAAGAVLAQVENGDLRAAVAQKQAALAVAEANLASLQAGTRPEQLSIDQDAVAQDQIALANAIRSAYVAADTAVHADADQFFTNGRTANAALAINVPDADLANRLVAERTLLEPVLTAWGKEVALGGTADDAAATAATVRLAQVSTFLDDAAAALSKTSVSGALSATTLASYQSAVESGRTSVSSAHTALASAAAALSSATRELALATAGSTTEAIAGAQAQVQVAQADLENAQAQLAKSLIVAPFAGVITRMDAKVGAIISPTDSQISLMGDGLFQVETYIPEVSIAGVAVGDAATTTLDAYGAAPFAAKVISVDPAETVKDGVPTYKTTLSFLAADPRIRSGMTANATIVIGVLHDAIVIPAGAVLTKNGTTTVSVLVAGKAVARDVTTGVAPALGTIQITGGLAPGDVLLLTPAG